MKQLISIFLFSIVLAAVSAEGITKELFLMNYRGSMFNESSELEKGSEGEIGKYDISNIVDMNPLTAWVEGVKGDGVGEYVLLAHKNLPATINIYSGYGKNLSLFKKNNRPKVLKVSLYFGLADSWGGQAGDYYRAVKYKKDYVLNLKDTIHLQTFVFPFTDRAALKRFKEENLRVLTALGPREGIPPFPEPPDQEWIIKLEIESVYKGSAWEDTCISEVFFNDRFISDVHRFTHQSIKKVYENDEGDAILLKTGRGQTVPICRSDNGESLYSIGDVSQNREWLTVIKQSWPKGAPRAETSYLIFNTFLAKDMKKDLERVIGRDITGPFSLVSREDGLFFGFYFSGSGEEGSIALK